MSVRLASFKRRFQCSLVGFLIALVLSLVSLPSLAQGTDTEPVFIDGIFLFDVPGSADLTAVERANAIETNLIPLLAEGEPVEVRVETRSFETGDPSDSLSNLIIFAGDRYIMTVTQADARVGGAKTPQAQAEIWVDTLNRVLAQAQAERQAGFWLRALVRTLAALAIALALHGFLGWLWQHWLKPLVSRFSFWPQEVEEQGTALGFLFRLVLFVLRAMVWFLAITYIANLFPFSRRFSYLVSRSLSEGLFARSLLLGDRPFSLLDLLLLVAALLALVVAANTLTNILRSRFLSITGISLAAQEAIAVLSKYTLLLLGTVVLLQLWGIDLSSIALIASGLGIGIGFGLQTLVKDFVSGLVIVFERPIQVGDFVDFADLKGTVTRIGSRSTEIRTLDQVAIIVPNSRFLDNEIINWSHGNPVSRIRLPVGVAYASDPEQVKLALLQACQKNREILATPAPQVFFLGFGDNALNFELLVWIAQPNRQLIIKSDLYFAIEASLREHHIEVPFPQRDLHIRSGPLPVDLSPEAQHWLRQLSQGPDQPGDT
ncbi:MAG TPA: mechanosensitive ion channel [Leptolyngbyaceae cyanobacterium M65_K2018_010]|nr:mechanosensitive ion channel [Leptolyngbyaceae cyanobacterium M65_K2018_010]